jgi:hypothetical protein
MRNGAMNTGDETMAYTTPETEAAATWFEGNSQAQSWFPAAIEKCRKLADRYPADRDGNMVRCFRESLEAIYETAHPYPADREARKAAKRAYQSIRFLEISEAILNAHGEHVTL